LNLLGKVKKPFKHYNNLSIHMVNIFEFFPTCSHSTSSLVQFCKVDFCETFFFQFLSHYHKNCQFLPHTVCLDPLGVKKSWFPEQVKFFSLSEYWKRNLIPWESIPKKVGWPYHATMEVSYAHPKPSIK